MSLMLSRIKEVVVLYGNANTGKSGILKCLCADLIKTVGRTNICKDYYGGRRFDKLMRFRLPDGRVLGVGTAGDSADLILQNFMWFHHNGTRSLSDVGCDIIVFPIRRLSQGRRFLKRYLPSTSHAEVEYEELKLLHGATWKELMSPNGGNIHTQTFSKRLVNHRALRKNDAKRVLKELHTVIGF